MTDNRFEHLDCVALKDWIESTEPLTLVDIRDPGSFAQGHIPGSRHMDNVSAGELLEDMPHEHPLIVVCYHGHSSQQAATWLVIQGYERVYSLDGGFTDWARRHPDRVSQLAPANLNGD